MHLFDEKKWHLICQEAVEFADFCAVVSARIWRCKLHRLRALNEEILQLSGEQVMDVAAFDASLQAMVRNRKLHDTIAQHLRDIAPEHLRQAQAIAGQYGYRTEREGNCARRTAKSIGLRGNKTTSLT